MEKTVKKYADMYRDTLRRHGIEDVEGKTQAYANLTRHIKFVRHSDLSDGPCCHDEVIRL